MLRKELFKFKKFCITKQSRIKKLVPFIYSQNPRRLFAMLVLSPSFFVDLTAKSKGKIQDFDVFYVSVPSLCTKCVQKIKELLRNF